ncbi:hypothetical protein ABZT47_39780 [Sphaerisporangium sp. NPDC005289]|uniref:hypothetical protein n=1 Tax=Sphaerisporangium sp. NPDC005289 TaxID=3155247 RepID=UPI0033A4B1FA
MPVLVMIAMVLIVSAIGDSAAAPISSGPPVASASPSWCDQPPSRALVRPGGGAAVTFPEVSYAVDHMGGRPRIDLGGSYQGVVDEGERVAVIMREPAGSYDRVAGDLPGEGGYFYQGEVRLDERAHCWTALALGSRLAWSPAGRPVWHVYLVLVPVDFAVMSVSARGRVEDGVFSALRVLADFLVTE